MSKRTDIEATNSRLDDPENGIGWARFGLGFGAALSIAGNVANVVLTPGWRGVSIPGAVAWPTLLFFSIEVMVRNRHHKSFTGYLARVLLMSVSVTTFLTSFVNLNGFLSKTHEPWLATVTGPIGIDGAMLGCTLFLLAASLKTVSNAHALTLTEDAHEPVSVSAPREHEQDAHDDVSALMSALTDEDIWAGVSERLGERPVSAPPVSVPVVSAEPREHVKRERAVSSAQVVAIEMLMSGDSVKDVVSNTEISRPTVQRLKNAVSMLMSDPAADVSAQRLTGEVVSYIRAKVSQP
jgi:hypothetical protein